jgi:hypothetical protein
MLQFDAVLIKLAQRLVHTIEGHSQITRKKIVMSGIASVHLASALMLVFIPLHMYTREGYDFHAPTVYLSYFTGFSGLIGAYLLERDLSKQKSDDMIPAEVKTGLIHRVLFLTVFLFSFLGICYKIAIGIFLNTNPLLFGVCFYSLTVTATKYLLCTTSLPPGDKKKIRQKKEGRSLATIPTGS